MTLSVLIPVYNAESYLKNLLDNLLIQTDFDMEIILANDGSTDGSLLICYEYQKKHPNLVKVINRENRGVVYTRRELISISKGEWIWFIDADDDITKNALSVIKKNLAESNSDMLIFDYFVHDKYTQGRLKVAYCDNKKYEDTDGKKEFYKKFLINGNLNTLWNKIFRRGCFDFEEDYTNLYDVRKANDLMQLLPIITKAKSIRFVNQPIYIYNTEKENRISNVFRVYVYFSLVKVWDLIKKYLSIWDIDDAIMRQEYYDRCCEVACEVLCLCVNHKSSAEKFEFIYQCMMNDGVFSESIQKANITSLPIVIRPIARKARKHNIRELKLTIHVFIACKKTKAKVKETVNEVQRLFRKKQVNYKGV